ncbi:hypothetical protein ACLIBG_06540 [Virgibacillus sp. W0181]|uniref:hypothetical protein n=1 Tax=Virgibacillus sp. W0181 TaxID=3391581 RepID=UPI003F44A264
MKQYKVYFLFIPIMFVIFSTIYFVYSKSVTTIKFFPIDDNATFLYANTNLKVNTSSDEKYKINWSSKSKTDKTHYLRQDVSLLYSNGKLKGIRSKWVENTDAIQINEELFDKGENVLETITFHHGEIHDSHDRITSIQTMSNYQLYIIKDQKRNVSAFSVPTNNKEQEKKELSDLQKEDLLSMHWKKLIQAFHIDINKYQTVPLTGLYRFNEQTLPTFTMEQTDQIIGQLWEGLYKNYVIPILTNEDKTQSHKNYTPLILFAKDNTHLIVLFELNGEPEKLIQKYSV